MKRADVWGLLWIPVRKRKPPETDEHCLIWNYNWDKPLTTTCAIARYGAIAMENGEYMSSDRIFSDWCKIQKPERKHEKKRKRSSRRRD